MTSKSDGGGSVVISIRLPLADYELAKAEAERLDRSLAWVMRDCLRKTLGKPEPKAKAKAAGKKP